MPTASHPPWPTDIDPKLEALVTEVIARGVWLWAKDNLERIEAARTAFESGKAAR